MNEEKKFKNFTGKAGFQASGQSRRRVPKRATPALLEKAALWYLERYSSTAANLQTVLMRRVRRSLDLHGGEAEPLIEAVQDIVTRFTRAGMVDDRAFAEARVVSLARRGKGARLIRQHLVAKGVEPDMADSVLAARREEENGAEGGQDPDFTAAIRYAQRRRIGPWRHSARQENRQRDMAALGRQGHDYETARKVIDAEDPELLLETL